MAAAELSIQAPDGAAFGAHLAPTPTDALQLTTAGTGIASGLDVSAEHKCPLWNSLGLATGFMRAPFGTRM